MYQSETAPWLEFFAWNTDGTAKTDLVFNTAGISIVVVRDNLANSAALTLSAASGPTDWAAGKFWAMGGNKYRVGISTALISSFTGQISAEGSYTGGVITGVTREVSAYNPTRNPSIAGDQMTLTDGAITAAKIADGAIDTATFAAGTTLPRVTLVDTCTTNSDMRGTDNAALAATALSTAVWTPTIAGRIDVAISSRSTFSGGAVTSVTNPVTIDTATRVKLDAAQPDYAPLKASDYVAPANSDITAIKAKTDNLPTDPADQSAVELAITNATSPLATQVSVNDIPTNAELATALAAADDAVLAAIAALNNLSAAQVNAELVDVLSVDTFGELSAPPAATSSLKDKLTWLFMWAKNKATETSTQRKLYADNSTTVVSTETVSDDGTTFTKSKSV